MVITSQAMRRQQNKKKRRGRGRKGKIIKSPIKILRRK
jgi:hypothetical protein